MTENKTEKMYELIAKKYSLPEFSKLDELFEVGNIESNGTKVLRDIRNLMMEKVNEYTRLVEMLINPSNAPPMFNQFVKAIDLEDRTLLQGMYEKLIELELNSLDVDILYVEKNEAEAIKLIYSVWNSLIEDFKKVFSIMKKGFNSSPTKKERSYFG